MNWFFQNTLADQAQRRDPRITLPRASLRGLPPVTIVNADIDPLRDDGAQLERALRAAGVPMERRVYDGVTHEFFGMAAVVKKAAERSSTPASGYARRSGRRADAGCGSGGRWLRRPERRIDCAPVLAAQHYNHALPSARHPPERADLAHFCATGQVTQVGRPSLAGTLLKGRLADAPSNSSRSPMSTAGRTLHS